MGGPRRGGLGWTRSAWFLSGGVKKRCLHRRFADLCDPRPLRARRGVRILRRGQLLVKFETGSTGLRAWHAVRVLSQVHQAVWRYWRFPGYCRMAPNWRAPLSAFWSPQRLTTGTGRFSPSCLWPRNPVSPKRRPSQAETRFDWKVTARAVQASGADETIRQAGRRGGPLPVRGGVARRWLP
jgi:hypothetical protein